MRTKAMMEFLKLKPIEHFMSSLREGESHRELKALFGKVS